MGDYVYDRDASEQEWQAIGDAEAASASAIITLVTAVGGIAGFLSSHAEPWTTIIIHTTIGAGSAFVVVTIGALFIMGSVASDRTRRRLRYHPEERV